MRGVGAGRRERLHALDENSLGHSPPTQSCRHLHADYGRWRPRDMTSGVLLSVFFTDADTGTVAGGGGNNGGATRTQQLG